MSSKNEDMPATVEPIDKKVGRAVRLLFSSHDRDQADGEILLSEARETVAALVEALKSMRTASTIEEAMIAEQKADAALRATGAQPNVAWRDRCDGWT